jgi:hypothetical protein
MSAQRREDGGPSPADVIDSAISSIVTVAKSSWRSFE